MSPKAIAVRADILDRLSIHDDEDTLPRGPRGLFYDLRPNGISGNPRGVIYTKHPQTKGRNSIEVDPGYVTDQLALMRRVWDEDTDEWLINEDWISDSRAPRPIEPSAVADAPEAARIVRAYIEGLHLARQAGQSVFLELRCESEDLMPRIARTARRYGVPVCSGSGMDGLKPKKEVAERAAERNPRFRILHNPRGR